MIVNANNPREPPISNYSGQGVKPLATAAGSLLVVFVLAGAMF
jgi:hypothetical protein